MPTAEKSKFGLTFLTALTPANLIIIVLVVSGFVINEAVFKADAENKININKIETEAQRAKIEEIEKKVEKTREDVVETKHKYDLILQKQEQLLEKLEEIKTDIKTIKSRSR
jgi:peptidoglycan hydrolase CwlO-like protein